MYKLSFGSEPGVLGSLLAGLNIITPPVTCNHNMQNMCENKLMANNNTYHVVGLLETSGLGEACLNC